MKDFDNFIETTSLVDIRLTNQRFTWQRSDGTSMSRLDKVLITIEMSNMGSKWVQLGIKRSILDHYTIIMDSRNAYWGPKPFCVLDVWQQLSKFKNLVNEKWNEMRLKDM
ncbi:hypothetical protein SLE2022_397380 [Rubroshorea leprosula]